MNREPLLRYATAVALFGLCLAGAAQTQQSKPAPQNPPQNAKQQTKATTSSTHQQTEGERIFAQNCARCHTPPDGFSPRISGTIVMHMRVRAALSAHDQQELLRFFNP
jgi:mono/diheme cytochrome c family protein